MLRTGRVSVPVAAQILGLSVPRVYAMANDGTLQSERMGGAVYVVLASLKAYQKSLKVPAGLILLTDAQHEYNYSRPTLWRRVQEGTLRKEIINERAYLHRTDLDKLYGLHSPTLSAPTKKRKTEEVRR